MNRLLQISLLTFFLQAAFVAQDISSARSGHFLGIQTEAGLISFREDLLVPLAFTGPGIAIGGAYALRTDASMFDVDLSVRFGYAVNTFSHEAVSISTRLRTAWLKKIRMTSGSWELWLGAVLPFRINDMYIFSWDDAHMYWVTSYGLGPTIQWRTTYTSEATIAVGLDLPVVHMVSRPPAYRFDKQDGMNRISFWFGHPQRSFTVEPIGSFSAVTLHGNIEWRSANALSSLGMQLRFSRMDGDKPVQDLNTLIVYSYRWGV